MWEPLSGKNQRYLPPTDYSKINSRWIYGLIIETIKLFRNDINKYFYTLWGQKSSKTQYPERYSEKLTGLII